MSRIVTLALIIIVNFFSISLYSTNDSKKDNSVKEKERKRKSTILNYDITVTATGKKTDKFNIPKAVSIIKQQDLKNLAPENLSELLTLLPGTDINGTGSNQGRPVIRGMRGQRVLLMADGLRLNNSRRQQDFGELPVLINQHNIDQIEIVRGPASVLYGSDAIGGVMNIISKPVSTAISGKSLGGSFSYTYGSANKQNNGSAAITGNIGKFSFYLKGNVRKTSDYSAPSGTFGNIRLLKKTRVHNTGVKDNGFNIATSWHFSKSSYLSFKTETYKARNAGFGYIDPSEYNAGASKVEILYPDQNMNRYTLKYENTTLNALWADRLSVSGYYLTNSRDLEMNIDIPMNIPGAPSASVQINSTNHTDVKTKGIRLELNKVINNHTLTYGFDYYKDKSRNRDSSTTTVTTFGPPRVSTSDKPQVPNAEYRSFGFFFQDDVNIIPELKLIMGIRYQNVKASTRKTLNLDQPLLSSSDDTLVGSANIIYSLTENLKIVCSIGRGFRSPNLIERFFEGNTPDGSGYQISNTSLKAETSLNYDLGMRYRNSKLFFEFAWFNNTIKNGIRVTRTGNNVGRLPEYQNINIDKLRTRGYEISLSFEPLKKFKLSGNFTKILSKDMGDLDTPYVDTYSSKLIMNMDYRTRKLYAGYTIRINGEQQDTLLVDNPIGTIIPGFTTHALRFGITISDNSSFTHQIGFVINNLTNKLYSEFSNTSFFRPSRGREFILTWNIGFPQR